MKKISFRTDVLPLKNELFRVALRITLNREDAEDVVQETMIRVWNKREQWEQIESIEAFCTTICRNLARDKTKRASNQDASLDDEGHDAPDHSYGANPEEQAVQRDKVERVRTLMNHLPEKQRTIIQLRDIEGKSYQEIANTLSISESDVKVTLFRARQAMKEKILQKKSFFL